MLTSVDKMTGRSFDDCLVLNVFPRLPAKFPASSLDLTDGPVTKKVPMGPKLPGPMGPNIFPISKKIPTLIKRMGTKIFYPIEASECI